MKQHLAILCAIVAPATLSEIDLLADVGCPDDVSYVETSLVQDSTTFGIDCAVLVAATLTENSSPKRPLTDIDLSGLPPEFADVKLPDAPNVVADAVVYKNTEFAAAVATRGSRVLVRGNVGGQTITASDIEIVGDGGSITDRLIIGKGVRRVSIRDISLHSVSTWNAWPPESFHPRDQISDIKIHNVKLASKGGRGQPLIKTYDINRILISRVSGAPTDSYGWYNGGNHGKDCVLADSVFTSSVSPGDPYDGEATVRIVGCDQIVAQDNRLNGAMKHTLRFHGASNNGSGTQFGYARRNIHDGGSGFMSGGQNADDAIKFIWIDREQFFNVRWLVNFKNVVNGSVKNSIHYSNSAKRFICDGCRAGWDLGGNQILPYQAP